MNFHQKRAAIKILILSLIIGVVIFTFFSVNWRGRGHFIQGFKSSSKLAYAKGISFVEYHGDKKVYAVSIDSFSIERARIGPFAIGPLHVAHLNKVNIDLYLDGVESRLDKEKGMDLSEKDFEIPISGIRKNLPYEFRKIRGIELKDISANLWRNEQKIFRISSDKATVDRKTGDIIFVGHANMDAGENGKLIAHRIRWDRETHLFRVTDPYILTKGKERRQGNVIETDYLFTRVSYRPVEK
jgi:hypothetical protein